MNAARLAAVQSGLAALDLDGALLTAPEHVWWLTGVAPGPGAGVLVAADATHPVDAVTIADVAGQLQLAGRRVGIDGGPLLAGPFEPVDATAVLADARRGKDAGEVQALGDAARAVDDALAAARSAAVAGATDHEIFSAAESALAESAGVAARLEGNVGAGAAGADPDALPSGVVLGDGDTVFVDLYPRVGWYYGDATRTFGIGRPTAWAERVHRTLWAAVDHAAAGLLPGAAARDIDARCREVLADEDLERHFPHHTGHGLGLFQQEPPLLVPSSTDVLRVGDVVTLEPGVYVDGVGGMRVEDAFVIEEGGARRLTGASRELSLEVSHG